MKRFLALLLLLAILLLTACGNKDKPAVAFEVLDVSPTGLTLFCTSNSCTELSAGSDYMLERNTEQGWIELEYTFDWSTEEWIIPPQATVCWKIDWDWWFGALTSGSYRISKVINSTTFYAEFEITDEMTQTDAPAWGINLEGLNCTSKGMTIRCTQSKGNYTGNELCSGSYFVIEQRYEDNWVELDHNIENLGWTAESWAIPFDTTVEWEIDWTWLYGELSTGIYRIGKEIFNFRATGDYDRQMLYIEFAVIN